MQSQLRVLRAFYIISLLKGLLRYHKIGNDRFFDIKIVEGKGIGLFTTIPRKKGSLVFIATGPARHAHFEGEDCYIYPDWYGVDKDTWIDMNLPYIKINHSCDPNTGIDGHRCFVALRDIQANEELTFDYSISDDEMDWTMTGKCECGAANCSGFIGPVQTMTQERYARSYPYIPKYFQALYKKAKTDVS